MQLTHTDYKGRERVKSIVKACLNPHENATICESNPRYVLRGLDSQQPVNMVGVHWLRISVNHIHFKRLCKFVKTFFDDFEDVGNTMMLF